MKANNFLLPSMIWLGRQPERAAITQGQIYPVGSKRLAFAHSIHKLANVVQIQFSYHYTLLLISLLLLNSLLSFPVLANFYSNYPNNDEARFQIFLAPWGHDSKPSLFYVVKDGTTSHQTEIHAFSPNSNYKDYFLHEVTGLGEIGNNVELLFGDWDGDGKPDLWAIIKRGTSTKSTEVHILSGVSNFKEYIFHGGTPLEETGDNFQFMLKDNSPKKPDLVAIKQYNTGTNSTELHILSGSSDFKEFSLHTGTALHETTKDWSFAMGAWKDRGASNLICISPSNGGEVHVLSQDNDYKQFIGHSILNESNSNEVFSLKTQEAAVIVPCVGAVLALGRALLATLSPEPFSKLTTYGPALLRSVSCVRAYNKYKDFLNSSEPHENNARSSNEGISKNEKSNGDNEKPKVDNDKPKVDNDKPKGGNDKPKGGGDKPKGGNDKPKGGGDKPKGGGDKPKGGGGPMTLT